MWVESSIHSPDTGKSEEKVFVCLSLGLASVCICSFAAAATVTTPTAISILQILQDSKWTEESSSSPGLATAEVLGLTN